MRTSASLCHFLLSTLYRKKIEYIRVLKWLKKVTQVAHTRKNHLKGGIPWISIKLVNHQLKKVILVYIQILKICRSKDLMVRGRSFYAIWDEQKQMWSTDESDVQRLVDQELDEYVAERKTNTTDYIEIKKNDKLLIKDVG